MSVREVLRRGVHVQGSLSLHWSGSSMGGFEGFGGRTPPSPPPHLYFGQKLDFFNGGGRQKFGQ